MIIKELKKIVFSKIIIALLISLCIVNVLYETRAEIETKEQIAAQDKLQKNKIDNYGKYLIKIKEDGTNMQSIVLFSKNNKFQLSNAKRTVKAYEAVKNVKPVYGNYRVIEKITEFGLTDIILFVMVVQIALILVSQEIKKGMLDLLKSCRNGRLNLIVNKMVALSITSAIAIIIVYGIKFVQLYIKYGLSGMNVPIQSVRGFYEFALPMQIWQYMIIYFMVKWIAVCIIGIVVIGIISLVKNETVTYGGGYFGVNSSHPLENPTYFANMVECWSILIIPMAMAFAFGFYLKRKKLGYSIYGVMLFAYLVGVCINVSQEMGGNPRIDEMGIAQDNGAMEGKEIRLGSAATALWSITTTVTSNGSVNGMHDSTMPLSGMMEMLNMQINTWFGGVGVGWMNYFTFIIIAVFISGLMVGRTPEFLGHKVEAREMKIASIVALLHPFIILVGTALAAYLFVHAPAFVESEGGWLNNPGYHGLSEMLYEYTSCAANNGSGFEGLGDNTWFWNYSCGIVLILGRFVPIVGQVAIAGILAKKKFIPESAGTLQTDTVTFGVMTFAVIFIVAALSFFPVHALSTIAEHLSL